MSRASWPIPLLWPDGPTAVILAGGPSLSLAQVRYVARARLENRCKALAVNDAVYLAWWADWLHGCDGKWWTWHKDTAAKFKGVKTTCTETAAESAARFVRVRDPATAPQELHDKGLKRGGFADAPDEVAGGGNGAYQAIQMLAKAGAKKILLLGVDMKPGPENEAHWFGEHPDSIRSDWRSSMLPFFPTLVEPLKERGVEVINCSPDSAIECFPKARLEDVL